MTFASGGISLKELGVGSPSDVKLNPYTGCAELFSGGIARQYLHTFCARYDDLINVNIVGLNMK